MIKYTHVQLRFNQNHSHTNHISQSQNSSLKQQVMQVVHSPMIHCLSKSSSGLAPWPESKSTIKCRIATSNQIGLQNKRPSLIHIKEKSSKYNSFK